MSEHSSRRIYLIVEFDWPNPVEKEVAQRAAHLHNVVQGQSWIQEAVAASGGLGHAPSSHPLRGVTPLRPLRGPHRRGAVPSGIIPCFRGCVGGRPRSGQKPRHTAERV